MDVVLCPEAYPHRLKRAGSLELHHVGNFTLDPRWDESQRKFWLAADAAGREGLSWNEYQRRVLTPLQKLGSLCYPEQDFELELAYSAYDDGVYNRGGYNAVSAIAISAMGSFLAVPNIYMEKIAVGPNLPRVSVARALRRQAGPDCRRGRSWRSEEMVAAAGSHAAPLYRPRSDVRRFSGSSSPWSSRVRRLRRRRRPVRRFVLRTGSCRELCKAARG